MTKRKQVKLVESQPERDPTDNVKLPDAAGLAKIGLDPLGLASGLTVKFSKGSLGDLPVLETHGAMLDQVEASEKGGKVQQRAMLIGQTHALNAIFVEMARRAGVNMGECNQAMELYMRLGLKAQAQSRATIEALERLDHMGMSRPGGMSMSITVVGRQ